MRDTAGRASRVLVAAAIGLLAGAAYGQIAPGVHITREALPNGGERFVAQSDPAAATAPCVSMFPPSLALTKAVDRHQVPQGGAVTYTFAVTNTGMGTVDDVLISDTDLQPLLANGSLLFLDFAFVSVPPEVMLATVTLDTSAGIFAQIDHLAPGSTFAFAFKFQVTGPLGATVTNQASAQVDCSSVPCMNQIAALSDDPSTAPLGDPTAFDLVSPALAPVVGSTGLLLAVGLLALVGGWALRRERGRA